MLHQLKLHGNLENRGTYMGNLYESVLYDECNTMTSTQLTMQSPQRN